VCGRASPVAAIFVVATFVRLKADEDEEKPEVIENQRGAHAI